MCVCVRFIIAVDDWPLESTCLVPCSVTNAITLQLLLFPSLAQVTEFCSATNFAALFSFFSTLWLKKMKHSLSLSLSLFLSPRGEKEKIDL